MPSPFPGHGGGLFFTTRWSMVLSAKDEAAPDFDEALSTLCQTYWYPLYAFVRGQGHGPEDAQDLTQEFFARLLDKEWLKSAAREKGRFRTFLCVVMKHFLANEWDRSGALKRGGRATHVALDEVAAEQRYRHEPVDTMSPDRIYERRWAMTLLEQAVAKLRNEYSSLGKEREFEGLKDCLTAARGAIPYSEKAIALGMSEGAVRVAVHRLRKRYREVFRTAILDTVSDEGEVEDELRHIAAILSEG
jgi:RNA polymerase sigma-70 factor (ECF subfamily)